MLPNFNMSGVVAVEHISHHFRELEIGDVVICISPAKPGRSVLKRVIGMVTYKNAQKEDILNFFIYNF